MNTNNDLKLGLEKKNAEIMAMNISNEDKRILLNFYYNEYKIKNHELQINNLFNFQPIMQALPQIPLMQPMHQVPVMQPIHQVPVMCPLVQKPMTQSIPQQNSNYSSSAYSFSQQLNPDGTYSVREHNKVNNNGNVDTKYNHYNVDANGNKTYFR